MVYIKKETVEFLLKKIRETRKIRGYSHEVMASELDISPSTYNKIERQDSKLTLERFLEIKNFLEIPTEELFNLSAKNIVNQDIKEIEGVGYQQVENLYQENVKITEELIKTKNELILKLYEDIEYYKSQLNSN